MDGLGAGLVIGAGTLGVGGVPSFLPEGILLRVVDLLLSVVGGGGGGGGAGGGTDGKWGSTPGITHGKLGA